MKKRLIIIALAALLAPLSGGGFGSVRAQKVTFYSPAFEEGVRLHLQLEENADVMQSQMDTITTLNLSGMSITDIRDAVYLPSLKHLNLSYNEVNDVSALLPLASLRTLNLKCNQLEDISILAFALADSMTVDVSNNYIPDFSYFFSPTHCQFSFIGMGEQSERDVAYFTVNHLYADIEDEKPILCYRGYTNMAEAAYVDCASSHQAATFDGNYQTMVLPDNLTETTMVNVSNGKQGTATYVVPPVNYFVNAGKTATLETGLPDDYRLSSAYASKGTVEIVGNTIEYTATDKAESDIVSFSYYQGSTLKGFSRFYINKVEKGDVNGDGDVDIADAVCIVNHIVGKPNSVFVEAAADVNNDGDIDIADAVHIVNYVVGKIQVLARRFEWNLSEPE